MPFHKGNKTGNDIKYLKKLQLLGKNDVTFCFNGKKTYRIRSKISDSMKKSLLFLSKLLMKKTQSQIISNSTMMSRFTIKPKNN